MGVLAVTGGGGVETVPDKNNRSPDKQIPRPDSSPDLAKVTRLLIILVLIVLKASKVIIRSYNSERK